MNQGQIAYFRSRRAQQLNDTVTDATTPVHRKAGRFVNDEQALVFVYHLIFKIRDLAGRRRCGTRVDSRRRDSDHIAGQELVFRAHSPAIDAHLAATKYSVQAPFRQARQLAAQKIIDPLARLVLINDNFADAGPQRSFGVAIA